MTNEQMDLDFTKEVPGLQCPYTRQGCKLVRIALGVAISFSVFLSIIVGFGLIKTFKLFMHIAS